MSREHSEFLVDPWLEAQCAELAARQLSHDDADMPSKAARALRVGAEQILQGRPSEAFLQFVAQSVLQCLDGEEPSMDHAFRLVRSKGRPKLTPDEEADVVAAFQHAMLPAVFTDLIEHLWTAWRNGDLPVDRVDAELQAVVGWLNTVTEAKPRTDFWRAYF